MTDAAWKHIENVVMSQWNDSKALASITTPWFYPTSVGAPPLAALPAVQCEAQWRHSKCYLDLGHQGPHCAFTSSGLVSWGEGDTPTISFEVNDKYPHKCPSCKAPAYMGLNSVDCSAKCKP